MAGEDPGVTLETHLTLRDRLSGGLRIAAREAKQFSGVWAERMRAVEAQTAGTMEHVKGLIGSVGVAFGAWKVAEKFVGLNAELEDTQKRFGGLLAGMYRFDKDPTKNLQAGWKRSRELMEEFREAGLKTGVSEEKYAGMASRMAHGWASARRSTAEMVPFVTKLTAVSRLAGVGAEEAAGTISMAVERGYAGRHSPLMQMLGLDNRSLARAKTAAARLKLVEHAMAGFSPEALGQFETFHNAVEKTRNVIDDIFKTGGRPLFDNAKAGAHDLYQYLYDSRDQIAKAVSLVGLDFSRGLVVAGGATKLIASNLAGIVTIAKLLIGYKIFDKVLGGKTLGGSFGGSLGMMSEYIKNRATMGYRTGAGELLPMKDGQAQKIGGLMAAGMVAEAALIGYAIGTALNDWLSTKDWWNKLWSPAEAPKSEVQKAQERSDFAAKSNILGALYDMTGGKQEGYAKAFEAMQKTAAETGAAVVGDMVTGQITTIGKGRLAALGQDLGFAKPAAAPKETPKNAYDFRGSRFEMQFAPGYDPDRIAALFGNNLAEVGERKIMSQHNAGAFAAR